MISTLATLLRKELRALLPFIWLLLVLIAVDVLYICTTEFPDEYGLIHWDDSNPYGLSAHCILLAIIAFTLAQGLLMRERAEDTLEFLDALPVSRTQVFFSKFFVGWLLLSLWVVIDAAIYFGLHYWSRESHNPELFPQFWTARLVILLWMNFVYLSIGVAASFIGRFGLLLIAFLILGVFILKERGEPMAALIDPFAVGDIEFDGNEIVMPWKILRVQLGIGIASLFLALLAFLRLAMPRSSGGFWRKAAMPIFVVGCILFTGVWITYLFAYAFSDEEMAGAVAMQTAEPQFISHEQSRTRTDDFVFIYPNSSAGTAETLIAESAATHATVTDFLKVEPRSDLVIDMTSTSPGHAGVAFWKRIRINLGSPPTKANPSAVFGHELTHVYIDQISENRLSDRFNSTRFFHEGLASYIEHRFFREPERLGDIRRIAAAAYDRKQVRFENIVSSSTLSSQHTSEWVYPLGEAFVSAVVDRFGDDAPQKLVRAFARADAPQGLRSMTLWQDTFQSCGYNLEEAIAEFFSLLEQDTKITYRDWLDQLPRLSGEVIRDGDRVGVRITRHSESPGAELDPKNLLCRFRSTATTPDHENHFSQADEDGIAWTAAEHFLRGGFWYQIGYDPPDQDLMFPIFDPWIRSRLPEE
jgi:hypothetical protein